MIARWGNIAVRTLLVGLALSLGSAASLAAEAWTAPVVVSSDVNSDGGQPRFATDRNGKWSDVWQRSLNGQSLYSRSTNDAVSWGTTTELPRPDSTNDRGNPDVAADITSGTFLAAWTIDAGDNKPRISLARTTGAQTTFTALAPIIFSNNFYEGVVGPRIAAGGNRVWTTVASSSNGTDEELAFFRTLDDGDNWTNPAIIAQTTVSLGLDRNLGIAADGSNNWVAVWERRLASNPSNVEVFYSRSIDNGASWAAPVHFNTVTPAGSQPAVASDTDNAFVAVFVQGTGASSIKSYRTTDGGATWSGPVAVNATGPAISDTPVLPDVACDGQGSCVAVWSATPSGASHKKLFFATSVNRGQTWSAADVLTSATVDVNDENPQVEYDGLGRWVTTWKRTPDGGGTIQILSSRLVFPIRADLSVTQTDNPDPAVINGTVTYSLTVKNDGPSTATNVVLKDTIPSTSTVSITQSQGTHTETSGTVTLTIGTMNPGATVTAAIAVKLGNTGTYTNVATLTNTEPDLDTKDRVSTETTRVLVEGIDLQGEWTAFEATPPKRPDHGKLRIKATLNVSDFGSKRAGQTVVLLMLSDDEVLSEDDAFVDSLRVDLLQSGETQTIKWEKTVHRHVPWQGRYIIAIVDSEKRIDEVDEDNNVVVSDQLPNP